MKSGHVYLHVYPREQIKLRLRGDLFYVFDIPRTVVRPIIREIYDTTGRDFPRLETLDIFPAERADSDHIIFAGVNKASVYDVIAFDPPLSNSFLEVKQYNHLLIQRAREFFLIDPSLARRCEMEMLPVRIGKLLFGSSEPQRVLM